MIRPSSGAKGKGRLDFRDAQIYVSSFLTSDGFGHGLGWFKSLALAAKPHDKQAENSTGSRTRRSGLQTSQRPHECCEHLGHTLEQRVAKRGHPLSPDSVFTVPTAEMNPASVMKLITTSAGLSLLGPDFTWRNKVWVDGPIKDGVLQGNLYFKGSGDPKLVVERLQSLLQDSDGQRPARSERRHHFGWQCV